MRSMSKFPLSGNRDLDAAMTSGVLLRLRRTAPISDLCVKSTPMALTTVGLPMRSAALMTSRRLLTSSPRGIGTPACASWRFASHSLRTISGSGANGGRPSSRGGGSAHASPISDAASMAARPSSTPARGTMPRAMRSSASCSVSESGSVARTAPRATVRSRAASKASRVVRQSASPQRSSRGRSSTSRLMSKPHPSIAEKVAVRRSTSPQMNVR